MNPDEILNLNEDGKDWDAAEKKEEERANGDDYEKETI